jgi:tetratricopeptide (TPR) repeat protein
VILKNQKIAPYLVLSLSLILRLLYFFFLYQDPILPNIKGLDSEVYLMRANQIYAGQWLGSGPLFHSGFLYPYILALFALNTQIVILVQLIVDSFSALFVYLLGKESGSTRTAVVAGGLYGICGIFIFNAGSILFEPWMIFLILAGLYIFALSLREPGFTKWTISGVAFSLASTAKPFLLIYLPVAVFYRSFILKKGTHQDFVRALIGITLGTCLVILPITLRNYVVTNDFTVTTSGGGFAFYLGNNPLADGGLFFPKHIGVNNSAEHYAKSTMHYPSRILGHKATPSEASRFWFHQGVKYWKDMPLRALALTGRKLMFLFNTMEVSDNYDLDLFKNRIYMLRWLPGSGILIAIGILGLFLSIKKWQERWFITLLAGLFISILPLFWISSRFRYPLLALFVLLGVLGIGDLVSYLSQKKWKKIFICLGIILAGTIIATYPLSSFKNKSGQGRVLGQEYYRLSQFDKALEQVEKGFKEKEDDPSLFLLKGKIMLGMGRFRESADLLKKAIKIESSLSEAHDLIEGIYADNPSSQEILMKEKIAKAPEDPNPKLKIAKYFFTEKRINESIRFAAEAVRLSPDFEEAIFTLAVAYSRKGLYKKSIEQYLILLKRSPDNPTLLSNLGFAYFDDGDLDLAEKMFKEALSKNSRFGLPYYGLGLVYKFSGKFKEAKKSFHIFLEYEPPQSYWAKRALRNIEELDKMLGNIFANL